MNLLAWAIRRPLPVILLFVSLSLGGILAVRELPVDELPNVDSPVVTIDASLPGATPSQVEHELALPVEQGVQGLAAIRHVSTRITEGHSLTTVEFALETDPREALERVRGAMNRVRARLPAGVVEPVVTPQQVEPVLLVYAVASNRIDPVDLSRFVDTTLERRLLAVPGVARVERQGGVERQIDIALDEVALRGLRINAAELARRVRTLLGGAPAANLDRDGRSYPVRVGRADAGPAGLGDLEIPLGEGLHTRLADIATIRDHGAAPSQLALLNGRDVVGVQVRLSRGADEIAVARGVRAVMETIQVEHPDIRLQRVADYVAPVQRVLHGVMRALYEGCVLAVLVVWLFLRDWRATVVAATALPLSILPAFIAMAAWGFSLNQLTLLALILVIGVLIDDAIVEVENIARHLGEGKAPRQAALDGAREIGIAVVATSLSLVAVFLPTAAMGGQIGRYFRQFGWTAAAAVLVSLAVARLLTPMMAAVMLRHRPVRAERDGRAMRTYLAAVRICIARPWRCLAAGAVFVLLSVVALCALPKTFLPAQDRSEIVVKMQAEPGSDLQATREGAEAARLAAAGIDGIASVYTTIGGDGDGDAATLTFALTPPDRRALTQAQIETQLVGRLARVRGARFSVGDRQADKQLSIVLSGRDGAQLDRVARRVEQALRETPGLGAVSSTAAVRRPSLTLVLDAARAAALGVTPEAAAEALRIASAGDSAARLPRVTLGGVAVPVRVHAGGTTAGEAREWLGGVSVPGDDGSVPLSSVAHVLEDSEPARIARRDGERYVRLDVGLAGRPLGTVLAQVDRLPALRGLPIGVRRGASGDAASLDELFAGFGTAMLFGLVSVYMILVLLFGGAVTPLTVLVALPLSLGGAAAMLGAADLDLSLASLIGLLMLMGLCAKNSILLVQYVLVSRARQVSLPEAVVEACRKRVRPIVMTTLAMIGGLLPLAIDAQADVFRASIAVTVIGGLISSTALSLLLVPVAFVLFAALQTRLARYLPIHADSGSQVSPADPADGAAGAARQDGQRVTLPTVRTP
ncbi:efflux RND transporter permease subunit [Burkholderia gladioli]|uniref:efflux RND transporter permease subunit n=1 Tax=Burkholderia gladioli TaxID=28095 RepID=UPI00163E41AD|nr:efflux RND transporter permease subunit [Burkholderia gladioli]